MPQKIILSYLIFYLKKDALKLIADVAQHLNDRIKDLVIRLLGVIIKIMNCTNFNVAISFIFWFQEQQATIVKLQKLFTGKEILVSPGRVREVLSDLYFSTYVLEIYNERSC